MSTRGGHLRTKPLEEAIEEPGLKREPVLSWVIMSDYIIYHYQKNHRRGAMSVTVHPFETHVDMPIKKQCQELSVQSM